MSAQMKQHRQCAAELWAWRQFLVSRSTCHLLLIKWTSLLSGTNARYPSTLAHWNPVSGCCPSSKPTLSMATPAFSRHTNGNDYFYWHWMHAFFLEPPVRSENIPCTFKSWWTPTSVMPILTHGSLPLSNMTCTGNRWIIVATATLGNTGTKFWW